MAQRLDDLFDKAVRRLLEEADPPDSFHGACSELRAGIKEAARKLQQEEAKGRGGRPGTLSKSRTWMGSGDRAREEFLEEFSRLQTRQNAYGVEITVDSNEEDPVVTILRK